MKKILATALVLLLALSLCSCSFRGVFGLVQKFKGGLFSGGLFGSGHNNTDSVAQEAVDSLFNDVFDAIEAENGIPQDVIDLFKNSTSWEVVDYTIVDDDHMDVTVRINAKDGSAIVAAWTAEMLNFAFTEGLTLTEDQMEQRIWEILVEVTNGSDIPNTDTELDLSLEKVGGRWSAQNPIQSTAIMDSLLGGFIDALDSFF